MLAINMTHDNYQAGRKVLFLIELQQYIEGHHFETIRQDDRIIVLIPVFKDDKLLGNEAIVCTTYTEARKALGY